MVGSLTKFRYAATPKRLRAVLGGPTVLDTWEALLVYELDLRVHRGKKA